MSTTPVTAADFLAANKVSTWEDIIDAGTIADTSTLEAIADDMLRNWTFDGALVPDRADLIQELHDLALYGGAVRPTRVVTMTMLDHISKAAVALMGIDVHETEGGWVWDATGSTTLDTRGRKYARPIDAWRAGLAAMIRRGEAEIGLEAAVRLRAVYGFDV